MKNGVLCLISWLSLFDTNNHMKLDPSYSTHRTKSLSVFLLDSNGIPILQTSIKVEACVNRNESGLTPA